MIRRPKLSDVFRALRPAYEQAPIERALRDSVELAVKVRELEIRVARLEKKGGDK